MPGFTENDALEVLHRVSHNILHQHNATELLKDVFESLRDQLGIERGLLTLRRGDNLVIEASVGLTEAERRRGQYEMGKGVTGKAAQTRRSILIPDISKDKTFLGRTGAPRKEGVGFICVPIIHEGDVVGTIGLDHPPAPVETMEKTLRLVEIVANILADAVSTLRHEVEERELLRQENELLRQRLDSQSRPPNIVGNCGSMRQVYDMIGQVADSAATVLIRGESGTGKELVARAIHHMSQRREHPFVAVNCAALPETLIESELFGHEKGAFTGALKQRKGRFELAAGGTLFLDEIGDINPQVQVKLLRVLQERVFERVGGDQPIRSSARVIAATSRDLEELLRQNKFREDLYYRLNVFPIHLPPLRNRKSDIILLADHFLDKYNAIYGKRIKRISTPALNMMMSYHWLGNIRELENCIERAVLMSADDVISAFDLPPSLQTPGNTGTAMLGDGEDADFESLVASFEREIIVEALKATKGNVAAAARKLRTTERIIHYKISKLGMNPKEYK